MPIYEDFENGLDQHRFNILADNYQVAAINGRLHVKSDTNAESEIIYNETLGYFNYTDEAPFYIGWVIEYISKANAQTRWADTTGSLDIATLCNNLGETQWWVEGVSEYVIDCGITNNLSQKVHFKADQKPEYYQNGTLVDVSATSLTMANVTFMSSMNDRVGSPDFSAAYYDKVVGSKANFSLYNSSDVTAILGLETKYQSPPNISKPVIPPGYYTENHTITAYSRVYDSDGDSMRANITVNTSSGNVETQYISSVTSFENDNANGWVVSSGGTLSSSPLESEGNYVYYLAYNDAGSSYSLTKTINLSDYDFMLFDYRVLDYKFWIRLNSTTIFTSEDENDDGVISIYNKYINLSEYGGLSTIEFYRDIIPNCLLAPWDCSNTKAHIDNIRLGAYFDNGEYNITSNTNITTMFNLQSGIGVDPQDLFDVSNNFTVVFNVSDSTGANTTDFSNLMNISNRKPTIANVTLKPILAAQNAALLNYDFYDPDDGHTNVSQFCRWYLNGTQIYSGGECELDTGNYSLNDILLAEVRATDGYNYSEYVNSTNLTVGDQLNPTMQNITVPESGVQNVEYPITIDCEDDLSEITSVTINLTDADNQKLTYSLDYYTGTTYRLLYTPGKAGNYFFTGARCADSSYNENVTTFSYQMTVEAYEESHGNPQSGSSDGSREIITETEVIVQKPENESLFLFKTPAGTGITDIILLPGQERKLSLKLISQHDKELLIKLQCSDETVANLCDNTGFTNETIKLKPSAVQNVDITIKAPDEMTYGDTGKLNFIAKVVVISSDGKTVDSTEQKVIRIQETISRWAYPALWGYNQFDFYLPIRGLPIPKIIVFGLIAGFMTWLFSLILKNGLALMGLFLLLYFMTSILELVFIV